MTINDYQDWTKTTAIYPPERAMDYLVAGLCSEAGEVAGKYKKIIRDKDGIVDVQDSYDIVSELSDVLWYVARIADTVGWDMSDVIDVNVSKLTDRQERDAIGGSGDVR